MKNWLNKYIVFTKAEFNGLILLLSLILLSYLFPFIYRYYYHKENVLNANDVAAIQKLELADSKTSLYPHTYAPKDYPQRKSKSEITYFYFDPNIIDANKWQLLGLSLKQAQSIVNYVAKGGRFYKPEDLKKMYTISPQKYEELLTYVQITAPKQENTFKSAFTKKEPVLVEINNADTIELTLIRGIGPAFARRIAKYRERLGGFYKKEQLMEVFGIDSAKYNQIKDEIAINRENLKKLNINAVQYDELKNHPYLTGKQANALIQYRKQHGNYKSVEDLNKVLILSPEIIQKISPYLEF
ncbi:ComEA family DNA-binding protein [Pedobacter montanisoli]|uniref:Helix-hairpin-helix domain-containing protein n=1 Tax=Pedobacter montanisoli TaxID=2923277 RepID=A0ABS9ZWR8_9SPHI|nr:helix-hairpin-helix domain-containing protein [Pedobacter montanisoli]MCJ0742757.1 helix-hairpin-helix domain-containing protein [Pedobacter montanisoli]